MRYSRKFSATSLVKGGGRPGAPYKRNPDPPKVRAWIERRPIEGSNSLQCSRFVKLRVRESQATLKFWRNLRRSGISWYLAFARLML
jgi:hypothetical protein